MQQIAEWLDARGNVKTIQFALPSRMIRHGPPRPKVHIPMLFVRERISHYHTPILSLHYLCDSCLTRHHFCLVVDCVLESGCELHKDAPLPAILQVTAFPFLR